MPHRKLLLALLAAGLCATAAAASARDDDDGDDGPQAGWKPQWTTNAPRDKVKAAFPKGAKESGRAALDCVATKDGKLVDCKIAKEMPAGQGFGAAALTLVGYERIKTKDDQGASVAGRPVRTWFELLAPGDANPDWLKRPTASDLAAVFPKKAVASGQSGRASIQCKVTVEGFLEACKVKSEDPVGYGFGAAALQLAPQLRMTPKIRGGKPVPGGDVTVPVIWPNVPQGLTLGPSLVRDLPWIQAPTEAQVKAAWPKEAAGLASGQAALRCGLAKTGALTDCDVIAESPGGKGFGKAAKGLAKAFRVAFQPEDAKTLSNLKVDLPFRFRSPSEPDGRRLTRPHWVRTLTAEGMALAYPEAAVKAGVKTGQGAARCTVTATGELADCQAVRESPAGLDFGAATIKAVAALRMNPWTEDGDPVEGLTITIPVQFNWEGEPPQSAKPAQGAAAPSPEHR
ncbi:TonB family protein [uncultured Caulobacter sp.]|uniref:TonB family protein n=1 Tax=uncultured Caulobacter sp. TaxID=158749 RepID=UPI002602848B|nr:TonB family protein [uncultured Caulobacter sp.]